MTIFKNFPCDWSYHGQATFSVEDFSVEIQVSVQLSFDDMPEVLVKIHWDDIEENTRLTTFSKFKNSKFQTVTISDKRYSSVIFTGVTHPPRHPQTQELSVTSILTNTTIPDEIAPESSIALQAYLNDSFSFDDSLWGIELNNIPSQERIVIKENNHSYETSSTGYLFRCGKSHNLHQDYNTSASRLYKNISKVFSFSFLELKIKDKDSLAFFNELIEIIHDISAFLSIKARYEILPLFYRYKVSIENNKISEGLLIPVSPKQKIRRSPRSLLNTQVHFLFSIQAILECSPLHKKVSRALQHLKLTVYDNTPFELKLMAACSSLEYMYSYWFCELNNYEKIHDRISKGELKIYKKKEKKSAEYFEKFNPKTSKNTPYITDLLHFLLSDLSIDVQKYNIKKYKTPDFITVRNDLLHGGYIEDETKIYRASDIACSLSLEVLIAILGKISRENDEKFYSRKSIPNYEENFSIIPLLSDTVLNAFF